MPDQTARLLVAFAAYPLLFLGFVCSRTLAGAFCGEHGSAVGLRFYFDAANRPAGLGGTLTQ